MSRRFFDAAGDTIHPARNESLRGYNVRTRQHFRGGLTQNMQLPEERYFF